MKSNFIYGEFIKNIQNSIFKQFLTKTKSLFYTKQTNKSKFKLELQTVSR